MNPLDRLSEQLEQVFQQSALPFSGYQLIESRDMVIAGRTRMIKLTRKWKRRRIKRITESVPNPDVIVIKDQGVIIGHPMVIAKLRASLYSQPLNPFSIGYKP